ncbi:hypothetical protein PMAYCL1PPCAC_10337, partial [Pristionchus mayeri]
VAVYSFHTVCRPIEKVLEILSTVSRNVSRHFSARISRTNRCAPSIQGQVIVLSCQSTIQIIEVLRNP